MFDIVIKPFMLEELRLKNMELLVYAILYDSMKYGKGYTGDLEELAKYLNIKLKTLFEVMKALHEKGMIDKVAIKIDEKKVYAYYAITDEETIKQARKKANPRAEDVREIFEYWIKARGKKEKTLLTDERRAKIRTRLNRFTVEEIKKAIDNIAYSSFHNGANDRNKVYDDLTLICRNDSTLEKWLYYKDMKPRRCFITTGPSELLEEQDITEGKIDYYYSTNDLREITLAECEYLENNAVKYEVGNYILLIDNEDRTFYEKNIKKSVVGVDKTL